MKIRFTLFAISLAALLQTSAAPFTLVGLPDTQIYNRKTNPNLFDEQIDWILANQSALNIVFVSQFGDFTDDGSAPNYWRNATAAVERLAGKVPYSVGIGNHDVRGLDGIKYSQRFSTPAHQGGPTFGGAGPDGLSFYQIFTADRFRILHLNLRYMPSDATLEWASDVVRTNAALPAIVTTHCYLNIDGNLFPKKNPLWDKFVRSQPSVFLVLCGHFHGEAQRLETNGAGGKVIQMLADYQNDPNGGNGCLRQITFDPETGKILFKTYATHLRSFRDGLNSEFSFDAVFDATHNRITVTGQTGLPPNTRTPHIITHPEGQLTAEAGATCTFHVQAGGTPPFSYQWRKNRADIPGATSPDYTTPPLTARDDRALFDVRVSNAAGSVLCKPCALSVGKAAAPADK